MSGFIFDGIIFNVIGIGVGATYLVVVAVVRLIRIIRRSHE